jgi:hypothetical protein
LDHGAKFLNDGHIGPTHLVFNRLETGRILRRKDLTNQHLSEAGILVPKMLETISNGELVFSNTMTGTARPVSLVDRAEMLVKNRYNTEFIETRREYRGVSYYSAVRLISVGRELLHAFVRMRPASDESPSVHAANVPLDPQIIEYFQDTLIRCRQDELVDLSSRLGDALGPGFFVHDVLVSTRSEQIFVCESGIKFHDFAYTGRLFPISAHLPSHAFMFSPLFARRSAEAFLRECRRHGRFLH